MYSFMLLRDWGAGIGLKLIVWSTADSKLFAVEALILNDGCVPQRTLLLRSAVTDVPTGRGSA